MPALEKYRKMRDFARTSEPRGGKAKPLARKKPGTLSYVVQRHDARRLHYDFRLELDGVLVSWAVPKGPSMDPDDKRLAVETEPHPLEYGKFEGTIAEGEYGAGTVVIWDHGTWEPEGDPRKDYERGRLSFRLRGQKLSGSFHLVRTGGGDRVSDGKKSSWLLMKSRDELARKGAGTPDDAPPANAESVPAAADYPLTHPDKVLYSAERITKRDLLDYYALVAERMLPHVQNRPLTLVRCPNGFDKPCFFQKHPGEGMPEGVRSVPIREKEGEAPYSVIDDERGLFGLVQLGALEIHTWGSHADDPEHPDTVVFDLDPDPSVPFTAVITAAREVRAIFERAKLESFVKTAGGKGLHVCIPIAPELDWSQVKDFSRRVAQAMAQQSPDRYLATATKSKRRGKIFIDYLRNARGATFVAPYSTRARDGAPVAVPLDWDELTPTLRPDQWNVRNLGERLKHQRIDPFARMAAQTQSLRSLLAQVGAELDK